MFAAVLLLSVGAEPVPTFEVVNKVPPFTVVNRVAGAPAVVADPTEADRGGFQWQRRGDGPWKLVAVGKEVSQPATPKEPPAATWGAASRTPARPAANTPGRFTATDGSTAPWNTYTLTAGGSGVTSNCGPVG